jgi:hypothetical protein
MSNRSLKRIAMVVALSVLPLLQGCVGGAEDEIIVRTAWMPVFSVSIFGNGGSGSTGQGTASGSGSGGSGVNIPSVGAGNTVSTGGVP